MKKKLFTLSAIFMAMPLFAATPIDLSTQSSKFLLSTKMSQGSAPTLQETNREVDANQTLHIRVKQYYQDIPVIGGDGIVHYPNQQVNKKMFTDMLSTKTTMDGTAYEALQLDLKKSSTDVFNAVNESKAKQKAIELFQKKYNSTAIPKEFSIDRLVYIDDTNQAHWAYQISFDAEFNNHDIAPTYLLDAEYQTLYQFWNSIQTFSEVLAGGYGGNHKTGKKEFDGAPGHLPAFSVQRDVVNKVCLMKNSFSNIMDKRTFETMRFPCTHRDAEHNQVYWNANHDQVDTTWSPSNDVMYGLHVGKNMFQDWYKIPVLIKNGQPMMIQARVHSDKADAYWHKVKLRFLFGNSAGSTYTNPFTQLDTIVHELAHGFTQQHSNLVTYGQASGLDESFSDITGIVAEYYAYGKTDYLVGLGDVKAAGKALRYMDKPSRDCGRRRPGYNCSIDTLSQYNNKIDPHHSSGIYNRFFYVLAHTDNWNAKKAFDILMQANRFYWTPKTTFARAACGVMKATADLHYEAPAVAAAFKEVGINTAAC